MENEEQDGAFFIPFDRATEVEFWVCCKRVLHQEKVGEVAVYVKELVSEGYIVKRNFISFNSTKPKTVTFYDSGQPWHMHWKVFREHFVPSDPQEVVKWRLKNISSTKG